ncbi:MAG: beta-galactosidase [Promethearchaeota archaeon]|nr:MAG: beta-galactosidase [Candidatus Lokiarchaeota archaeon]
MSNWRIKSDKIFTRWAKDVDPENPLPEYPRPQLIREKWLNLNGLWDYTILNKNKSKVDIFEGKILVPYPIESALSGVNRKLKPKEKLWYRRYFSIPEKWTGKKILLHFGAVDFQTNVWVNEKHLGTHEGGYTPFSFEISDYLQENENELMISVWDPTGKGCQERGKQLLRRFLIFYTAVSGIWQTVWLEPVSSTYIEDLKLIPDINENTIELIPKVINPQLETKIKMEIKDSNEKIINSGSFKYNEKILLKVPGAKLWSPQNPYLYGLVIELSNGRDEIDHLESYFGMRKISIEKDGNGIPRIHLNDKQIFQYGTLDQGYWPDGLYTAPTDEALKYDIEITKELGFNMIRKHVKIEPARWYYHCDRIGMLVWQDMPNGGKNWFIIGRRRNKKCKENYYNTLESMITNFYNSPSIIVWVPFNESWGQFETKEVTEFIRNKDPTRLIDSASGYNDKKVGDIKDIHKYPGPKLPKLEEERVAVLGEFGGLGLKIEDHIWREKKFNWAYRKSKDPEKFAEKYRNLISELKPLIKQGLCAAVYTQITDVEGEINGLLTYDREVIKIDKNILKRLHLGLIK